MPEFGDAKSRRAVNARWIGSFAVKAFFSIVAMLLHFASARRSALLYPGPLWRGRRLEESQQDGPRDAGQFFAGTRRCRRKTP